MTKRNLLLQIGITLAIVALYNPLVSRAMRNAPAYHLAAAVKTMQPASDIFLGNSLMEAGFNEAVFKGVHPDRNAFKLALQSTWYPEHYCLLEEAKAQPGATVYLGFFGTTLTQTFPSDWSAIAGNRLVGVITAPPQVAMSVYASNDPLKALEIGAATKVPIFLNRLQIWSKTELLRRKIGAIGLPPQPTSEFGSAKDFADFANSNQAHRAELLKLYQEKIPFSLPVQKIIDLCRARKLNLIFINMPANADSQRNFYGSREWHLYESHIVAMMKAGGAKYIDATSWNPDQDFSDGFHLTRDIGGARFTKHLLTVVK